MIRRIISVPLLITALIFCFGNMSAQDKFLDLMDEELKREYEVLKKQETPPYFMSYRVNESQDIRLSSSFGNIVSSREDQERYLTVRVRVGDHQLDNTHEIRGDRFGFFRNLPSFTRLPEDNNPDAIRQILWKVTNDEYRQAVDNFSKVKANVAVKVANEDSSADFSFEKGGIEYVEPRINYDKAVFDKKKWEERIKSYSKMFLDEPDIYSGSASVSYSKERRCFVSTEGNKIAENLTRTRLRINAHIKSDDGMELPLYRTFFAFKPEDLPSDEEIKNEIEIMIEKLKKLKTAPVVDPYSGPAILSGRASGVFFHEIFGHRIEGHRQKSENEGQTFKKMVGENVLADHLTVYCEPAIKDYKGVDLNGYYHYDDEGMKGQKVIVVDNGVMKNFLMNRNPIENFPQSNGHGRAAAGYKTVSRQSNLIVESSKPLTKAQLRQKLIDECKAQGKEYGYFFEDITGGFTITGRTIPNAFNVMPTEVYRVYVDGRPDELVRGVDIVGTPLAMFSQIEEVADDFEVFNGTCGAESGGVPVSAVSPSIFVKMIEMQKKTKSQERPVILPRPGTKPEKD